MADIPVEEVKPFIDEVMKIKKVKKYELKISGSASKSDGYFGKITFVNVKTSSKKDYDFVIKSPKTSDKLREEIPIKENYLREIYIYSKVFPVFQQFQSEYGIKIQFRNYPKCYNVCEEEKKETLVLKNMISKKYELHERMITMDLNHVQFVLTHYARLHGVSIAIKQLKPELFASIARNMNDILANFVLQTNMITTYTQSFANALKLLTTEEAKKFEGYESEIEKLLTKTVYNPEDPVTVVLHGDCWNNNFLFKYDETDKSSPVDVCLLDFQFSRVAHPILDLSYFLYVCCDKKLLERLDFLLEVYHSALSAYLSQYRIDPDKIYPLAKLRRDWKTLGKYGLYLAVLVLKLAVSDTENAVDFGNAAEDGKMFAEEYLSVAKDNKVYQKRVKDILEHFSEIVL